MMMMMMMMDRLTTDMMVPCRIDCMTYMQHIRDDLTLHVVRVTAFNKMESLESLIFDDDDSNDDLISS